VWGVKGRSGGERSRFSSPHRPSRRRPLDHRALRACCRRPRRVFGGCAPHGQAGLVVGRGGSEEEEGGGGGGGGGGGAAGWRAHQQRQTDNKKPDKNNVSLSNRQFGPDRSPYFGYALMRCCISPFVAVDAAISSISLFFSPLQARSGCRLNCFPRGHDIVRARAEEQLGLVF